MNPPNLPPVATRGKNFPQRECGYCGRVFTPQKVNQKYCCADLKKIRVELEALSNYIEFNDSQESWLFIYRYVNVMHNASHKSAVTLADELNACINFKQEEKHVNFNTKN